MDLAGNLKTSREVPGENRLQGQFILGIQPVDGLFQRQLAFGPRRTHRPVHRRRWTGRIASDAQLPGGACDGIAQPPCRPGHRWASGHDQIPEQRGDDAHGPEDEPRPADRAGPDSRSWRWRRRREMRGSSRDSWRAARSGQETAPPVSPGRATGPSSRLINMLMMLVAKTGATSVSTGYRPSPRR